MAQLTIHEYCDKHGLKVNTVRNWLKKGKINDKYIHVEKSASHKKMFDDVSPDELQNLEGKEPEPVVRKTKKSSSGNVETKTTGRGAGSRKANLEELKIEKIAEEVKKLQLANTHYQAALFREWSEIQQQILFESFAPFKVQLKKSRLTADQATDINKIFDKCKTQYSQNLLKKMQEAITTTF